MELSTLAGPGAWMARSAPEIASIGERDGSIVIVPVGSVEQHGNHLPVGTDTFLATGVTEHAVDAVSDDVPALVTPPVWTGHSPHHLSIGGTASLSVGVMMSLLSEVAETTMANGFDAIIFVNGHGGNIPVISSSVSEIGAAQPDREVLGLSYFDLAADEIDAIRDSDVGGMGHGGEFETSLMLYLYPELVDETDMEAAALAEPYDSGTQDMFAGGPLSVYRDFEAYSSSGAIGDPSVATPEKGRRILEIVREELVALLREIHDRNR